MSRAPIAADGRRLQRRVPVRAAFSLIEMLAVTAILLLIVVSIVTLFMGADRSRSSAESRAGQQTAAAVALGTLTRDLEEAVADEFLTFSIQPDRHGQASHGVVNSELACLTLADSGTASNRAVQQVFYWVEPVPDSTVTGRYQLVRSVRRIGDPRDPVAASNSYWNGDWHRDPSLGAGRPGAQDVGVLLRDVTAFRLGASVSEESVALTYRSDERGDRLPGFVDIYLETVDAGTARRLRDLAAQPQARAALLERAAMSWASRVRFHNASGPEKR